MSIKYWTPSAVECYERGCKCKGCFYDDFFKDAPFKCKMKQTVLWLVGEVGRPDELIDRRAVNNVMLTPQQYKVLQKMRELNDFTLDVISKEFGYTPSHCNSVIKAIIKKTDINIEITKKRVGTYWINRYKMPTQAS